MKRLFCLAAAILFCLMPLAGCAHEKTDKSITIASKTFTENILLSEIYAQLMESYTDITVTRKYAFGSTALCYTAIEKGEIDMYVEYTGTLYSEILGLAANSNLTESELFDIVKKNLKEEASLTAYMSPGLNNTFALAMQKDKADALHITTISDLNAVAPKLIFGANSLFYARAMDGYDSLVKLYGLEFQSVVKLDTNLLYDAVNEGNVDVMVVYATDSLLKKYNMVLLEDNKKMFPVYEAVPIIRDDVLKSYPELDEILGILAGRIDNQQMQNLNYLVDVEMMEPAEAARLFLTDEELLKME